jgi:hypothetical protein
MVEKLFRLTDVSIAEIKTNRGDPQKNKKKLDSLM